MDNNLFDKLNIVSNEARNADRRSTINAFYVFFIILLILVLHIEKWHLWLGFMFIPFIFMLFSFAVGSVETAQAPTFYEFRT
jgi:hypothetical protein